MLNIVKTIKLLDDLHYEAFRNYVKNISIRSYYPLALIDVISRDLEIDQDTDYLCKAVYSDLDDKTRKRFYQLAHYSFGLTSFLAKNYPDYLAHNISRFQDLINKGALEKANQLAIILLESSEKIEDYATQSRLYNILAQQSILLENSKEASGYIKKARTAIQNQDLISSLFEYFYATYHLKTKPGTVDIEKSLDFFRQYFDHPSMIASITSRCCYCFFLHFHKDNRFYTAETIDLLNDVENDLEKNNYLTFPYLVFFTDRVKYFKLRYKLYKMDIETILKKSKELLQSDKDILYWNSYINQPEMFMISAKANFYISNYMKAYRDDNRDWIPEEIREDIEHLKKDCKAILNNKSLEQNFTIRYINLTTIYCVLLLVDGKKEQLEEAISILNQTLTSFQQVSFQAYADAIYSIIGTAYFCLKDYKNVESNYMRYRKAINKKALNPVNEMTIYGFYYAAKWLETGRDQYAKKLNALINSTQPDRFSSIQNTLKEVIDYYKIPAPL